MSRHSRRAKRVPRASPPGAELCCKFLLFFCKKRLKKWRKNRFHFRIFQFSGSGKRATRAASSFEYNYNIRVNVTQVNQILISYDYQYEKCSHKLWGLTRIWESPDTHRIPVIFLDFKFRSKTKQGCQTAFLVHIHFAFAQNNSASILFLCSLQHSQVWPEPKCAPVVKRVGQILTHYFTHRGTFWRGSHLGVFEIPVCRVVTCFMKKSQVSYGEGELCLQLFNQLAEDFKNIFFEPLFGGTDSFSEMGPFPHE